MKFWDCIRADSIRQFGKYNWLYVIKGFLFRRTFRVLITLRLCQNAANSESMFRILFPFFKILHRISSHLACVDFPYQTKVGAGLSLTHGWGLVINPGVQIGKNVTIFHGVTLGQRDHISSDGKRHTEFPVIEDEVWIGPHAIIVGRVTIGRGSRIAGGAFITNNIPPYSIVLGNPGKIVKSNCIPDIVNPASF